MTTTARASLTLKVGTYENRPKIFTDDAGNMSGFWPDIIAYIASREGWQIEYVHGTWSECLERLKNGDIDILPDIGYTEERAALYSFSSETVLLSWSRVYASKGSNIQSILDLDGKKVAVLAGSINVEGSEGIKHLLSDFEVNCTYIEADSYAQVFELLKTGQADAGVTNKDFGNSFEREYGVERTAILFLPSHIQFAFPKGDAQAVDLAGRIDDRMRELKADTSSVYYQAMDKWLGVQPAEKSVVPVWVVWTLVGVGGLAVLLGGGSLVLRRQVRVRTRALTTEIAERKQAEEALKTSEQRWQFALEGAGDGVWDWNAQTNNVFYSRQWKAMLGYAEDEIGGTLSEWDKLVHPADRDCVHAEINKHLNGKTPFYSSEHRVLCKDGSYKWILDRGRVISRTADGKPLRVIGTHADITERKKMDEQLILTDRLASIGELASGIAHELNNPLTGVIGLSQLVLEKDVPEDIAQDLKLVSSEAQRAANVVKNLLTFARRHPLTRELIDVHDVINKVFELRAYEHKVSNIRVVRRMATGLPQIKADYFQIQQVVLNIIINAEYFMTKEHGKGTLTIATERVGSFIRVSISDDGPGIPEEDLGRIFNPFFTTKEVGKGTGLGLSICHGIVTAHQGTIRAESKPGHGATFIVELPIGQSEEQSDKH